MTDNKLIRNALCRKCGTEFTYPGYPFYNGCPNCDSTDIKHIHHSEMCSLCNGTGKVMTSDVYIPDCNNDKKCEQIKKKSMKLKENKA